jgi:hypothetical protein
MIAAFDERLVNEETNNPLHAGKVARSAIARTQTRLRRPRRRQTAKHPPPKKQR